ncbi:hypothetical protein CAPTEDRAFT_225067 [Capitella teleta]|uniref:Peptidase M14 domain-containing protein n=1 Tax=Capitella teleta TaxID=283909 RepID=R7TVL8_CAPTE|nr:hypothetical protein CAPTEDRAFT_225067 [Capitella teleta]|eukprot:ELT95055.1 hypothetical protein CAPTEDRAFT_225067 [Capitella teleta]
MDRCWMFSVAWLSVSIFHTFAMRYDGHKLVQLKLPSADTWSAAYDLLTNYTDQQGIDIWRPLDFNLRVDIQMTDDVIKSLRGRLKNLNIEHDILMDDIQSLIDFQERERRRRKRYADPVRRVVGHYASYDEIVEWMEHVATTSPDIAEVFSIGKTLSGRDMRVLKLGVPKPNKWSVFVDAGIHSREWIAPATVIYMANQLIEGYLYGDYEAEQMLESLDWYILPLINIDGYEHSFSKNRLWRKNRRLHKNGCVGVDLNRNWNFHWGEVNASPDPCNDLYRGDSASSEPEVQNMANFLMEQSNAMIAYISYHSYGQRIFTRWDFSADESPDDHHELLSLAIRAADAISAVNDVQYDAGISPELMYPFGGGSADWAKGVANIKYSYLVELRDRATASGRGHYGFLLPPDHIRPSGEENWAGMKVIAKEIMAQYGHVPAPTVERRIGKKKEVAKDALNRGSSCVLSKFVIITLLFSLCYLS